MSTFLRIYAIRGELARLLQPEHEDKMRSLDEQIPDRRSPYEWDATLNGLLMAFTFYKSGARGIAANLGRTQYLYRLCVLASVYKNCNWRNPRFVSFKRLFSDLWASSLEGKRWLHLSDYATGDLSSKRAFTWWTSHRLKAQTIMQDLAQIGVPADWIYPNSVLLRAKASVLKDKEIVKVPTVIDGFDAPIFNPTRTVKTPRSGLTIDLTNEKRLRQGKQEFCLKPLPVEAIEFLPVSIDKMTKSGFERRVMNLLPALETFYRLLYRRSSNEK